MKNLERLRLFLRDPIQLLDTLAAHGDMQRTYIGPKPFVFVFNAHAAREILVHQASSFGKNPDVLDKIIPVTGKHGLVQLEGKQSQDCRKKARTIFTNENLATIQIIVQDIVEKYVGTLDEEKNITISHAMTDLILSTAFRIFLGLDLTHFSRHIGRQFLRLNQLCGRRMMQLIALPLWLPTIENLEIRRLRQSIRRFISKQLIGQHGREENVATVFAYDEHLIDQCMTFLFAGHETTASSLAFSFLLLANHPHYQHQIAQGNAPLTKALYQESLRLYPPAYMVTKRALENTRINGLTIYKGDQILIGIKQIHYSSHYFEKPHQFNPQRFLDTPHNDAFIPFSLGAKSCIGERLAYLEASIVLHTFCKKFIINPINYSIQKTQLITLHPQENQLITFSKR